MVEILFHAAIRIGAAFLVVLSVDKLACMVFERTTQRRT